MMPVKAFRFFFSFSFNCKGNAAICRSYLAAATRSAEISGAMAMASLAQVLGFIIGPLIQTITTSLGDNGVSLIPGFLMLNMYTAVSLINFLLGLFNLYLLLPFNFKV